MDKPSRRLADYLLSLIVSAFAAIGVLAPERAGAEPSPITTCSDERLPKGIYYLTNDLDCNGETQFGIWLSNGARVEFRGFAIRNAGFANVLCDGRCTLIGPGVTEDSRFGIRSEGRLKASDLTVRGNWDHGIWSTTRRLTGSADLVRCTIENNFVGVYVHKRVKLVDSIVTANEAGGVIAFSILFGGLCRGGADLENSVVANNSTGSDCPNTEYPDCADLTTCRAPRLDAQSECGTSTSGYSSNETWEVCNSD